MITMHVNTSLKKLFLKFRSESSSCKDMVNTNSDIHVFHAINNERNLSQSFVPFPGYSDVDRVPGHLYVKITNGRNQRWHLSLRRLYGFTGQEFAIRRLYIYNGYYLPAFKSYRIKIVLATCQVSAP